jgi:ribosomal protein S14
MDNNKRIYYKKKEPMNILCSALAQSRITKTLYQLLIYNCFFSAPITMVKNRCIYTQKSKSVASGLKMSRVYLKKKILSGDIPGYYRAV